MYDNSIDFSIFIYSILNRPNFSIQSYSIKKMVELFSNFCYYYFLDPDPSKL